MAPATTSSRGHFGWAPHQKINRPAAMPEHAISLAIGGIARSRRQACSVGPKRGWSSSQASSLGDERAKHPAAMIRNTVVGISGTNAPMKPRAMQARPSNSQARRAMGWRGGAGAVVTGSGEGVIDQSTHPAEGGRGALHGALVFDVIERQAIEGGDEGAPVTASPFGGGGQMASAEGLAQA